MEHTRLNTKRAPPVAIGLLLLLSATLSTIGITWGLPDRSADRYLFDGVDPWSGADIARRATPADRYAAELGADVDRDPLDRPGGSDLLLTDCDARVAEIYRRYRLFTHQPDEMITMMALQAMRPGRLELDPKLYQYGGLFIYPVGGLIALGGAVGLIDVRADVAHYLDHPEAFGRFYVAARIHAAAWGALGAVIVFFIGRRFAGGAAGLLAGVLFTLLPVVVCMSHEGKPHLPGAVLMLCAVWFGVVRLEAGTRGDDVGRARRAARAWWAMCAACGAALGMVLSSLPILLLIPVVALAERGVRGLGVVIRRAAMGLLLAGVVYIVTNPYVAINAVVAPEILRSNFGNSLAMYEVARAGEGAVRVMELMVEGATLPVVVFGLLAGLGAVLGRRRETIPLVVAAALFAVQFVLLGAGKPAEYGRFGVFPGAAFAIGTACVLVAGRGSGRWGIARGLAAVVVVAWVGWAGARYAWNFHRDAGEANTRRCAADELLTLLSDGSDADTIAPRTGDRRRPRVALLAEPAPYGCPPLPFARLDVWLCPTVARGVERLGETGGVLVYAEDDPAGDAVARTGAPARDGCAVSWPVTRISWANKPFLVVVVPRAGALPP
jgi:hypothetical protein